MKTTWQKTKPKREVDEREILDCFTHKIVGAKIPSDLNPSVVVITSINSQR
jgi:hypothetical protein